jgi:hypothetical protein
MLNMEYKYMLSFRATQHNKLNISINEFGEILERLSLYYFGEYYLNSKIKFNTDDIIIVQDSNRLFLNLDNINKNLPFTYSGIDVFEYPLHKEVIEPLSSMESYQITGQSFEQAVESHPDL